jgi:hypothetical protein
MGPTAICKWAWGFHVHYHRTRARSQAVAFQCTEICVKAPKILISVVISAVRETEMIADPKRKPHQDDGDSDKRRRQEEALGDSIT